MSLFLLTDRVEIGNIFTAKLEYSVYQSLAKGMLKIFKVTSKIGVYAVIVFLCSLCAAKQTHQEERPLPKVVMGYYYTLERDNFDHTKIEYKHITHLAHAFTMPDSEGNLVIEEGYLYPELITAAHKNGVKVIMSVGGWGRSEGFPGMAQRRENRQRFIEQVLDFCETYSYDGVDIDWEYVSNPEEQEDFIDLSRELSDALKSHEPPLLLTIAVPAGHFWGRWFSYEEVVEYYDFISFMTYDFHGEWTDHSGHNSPLYRCYHDLCGSVDDSYKYALSRQIPKEKLLLGIPFYGRSFDCGGLYQKFHKCESYSFAEVMDLLNAGWNSEWDDCAKVPYLLKPDRSKMISYENERSVRLKCQYIKEKDVAGVILWELSDDHYQGSSALLDVVSKSFGQKGLMPRR
ncbi:MAG: glycoside hydrolase family 18 protein [Candidatus Aminicenantes bacterium]